MLQVVGMRNKYVFALCLSLCFHCALCMFHGCCLVSVPVKGQNF